MSSLGSYLSSQTFHAFDGDNAVSRWEGDTHIPLCATCGLERYAPCHPQRDIPLSNAHMAIGQLIVARQHLRAAAEMINVGGPTVAAIRSNLLQRAASLDSIEAQLTQARIEELQDD